MPHLGRCRRSSANDRGSGHSRVVGSPGRPAREQEKGLGRRAGLRDPRTAEQRGKAAQAKTGWVGSPPEPIQPAQERAQRFDVPGEENRQHAGPRRGRCLPPAGLHRLTEPEEHAREESLLGRRRKGSPLGIPRLFEELPERVHERDCVTGRRNRRIGTGGFPPRRHHRTRQRPLRIRDPAGEDAGSQAFEGKRLPRPSRQQQKAGSGLMGEHARSMANARPEVGPCRSSSA